MGHAPGMIPSRPMVAVLLAAIVSLAAETVSDPLPPGALLRLGTLRFRCDTEVRDLVYSPDGCLLVA